MTKSDLAPIEVVACLSEKESIRVLHVDDEASFLKVTKECLETEGPFKVDTASSVDEALKKMKEEEYDAIISDYQMPGKDGLEFLKQLRKKDDNIPFIIFTGRGREEVAIKALNLGADRYLNKMGDPEAVNCELAHAIRQAVDKRSAQIESLKREAKLNAILESSPEAITITNLDGNIIKCNQATADLHGDQSKEDLIGTNAFEVIAKKDRKKAIQDLKKTIEQGPVKTVEYTLLTKDGHEFPGELSLNVVKDPLGKPECFVAIIRDITERKKAEETVIAERDRLETVTKNIGAGLAIISKDYRTLWANDVLKQIFGDAQGKFCYSTYNQRNDICPGCGVHEIFEAGESKVVHEQVGKDVMGETVWSEITATPVKDRDGIITAALELVVPITQRKKAEEAVRGTKEYLDNLLNYANAPVIVWDNEKKISLFNNAFEALTGHKKAFVLGRNIDVLFPPLQKTEILEIIERATRGEKWQSVEVPILCKDGETRVALWNSANIQDKEGNIVATIAQGQDITERKKSEADLRRLATIVTDSNDAITVVDMDGRITAWNKGAEHTYGYRKDETLGMDVLKIVPEDKKQETLEVIGKIKMNETVRSFETQRLAKDGRVLDVWLTATKLVDDEGNAVALATTERDITEKKRLEEKLRSSEKLTVLGQLASSVAHEIRNPLGVIKNSVYFLNIRLKEHADEKVVKHLRIMERNVNSADRIISDLLDFGRNKVGVLEPVDLNGILKRAFASLSMPENIKVITKLDKIPKTLLDPESIQRVFVNMIQNAVAAMPEGGKLTVGTSRGRDSVEISFKDSGVGIPHENMQKLFTPMFTTKAKGLGLGLAICKQIVEGHNGDIEVKSEPGEGALFIVRLPILSGADLLKTGPLHSNVLTEGMSK